MSTQTGRGPQWSAVAVVSLFAASALLVLRPGCAPRVLDVDDRSLELELDDTSAPAADAAPATLAAGTGHEARSTRGALGPAQDGSHGSPDAGRSAGSVTTDDSSVPGKLITLEVVQRRGAPVPHAKVTIDRLWFHPSAAPRPFDVLELTADGDGRVRFDYLAGLGQDVGDALDDQIGLACIATDGGAGASPELLLAPPVGPGPHTLSLGAAAALTLEVVEGTPPLAVEGASVALDRMGREGPRPVKATTDTRGLARFDALPPGAWSYYVQPPGAEHNVRGRMELAPGEDRALTVALDEGEEALAVAGRFVDENGATIELGRDDQPKLWVGADLNAFGTATGPSADGTFRVYLPRSEDVLVRNFGGHRYEPELTRVPFGTQDLLLRRVERFPARTIVVEARDVTTGAMLNEAHLTVFEDDARSAAGMSLVKRPSPGRLETTLHARPSTRLAVWCDEYAPRFMALPPTGATTDSPLAVHLERGGPREVYVVDAATLQAVAGVALVAKNGATVSTTDGAGRAEVSVAHGDWLTLRSEGYTAARFHPTWPWDRVHLVRE